MSVSVFRNGRPLDPEQFAHISEVDRTEAMRRFNERQRLMTQGGSAAQSGGRLAFGTPRKGKNTRFAIFGVRVS